MSESYADPPALVALRPGDLLAHRWDCRHGVDVEGLRCGIQEDLVVLLSKCCTIPVTYAGGARSMDDLKRIGVVGQGKIDSNQA